MDANLRNQVNGLWERWLETPDGSIQKDKLAAEIAKFLVNDIDRRNLTLPTSDDELEDVIDVLVECNAGGKTIRNIQRSIVPVILSGNEALAAKTISEAELSSESSRIDISTARPDATSATQSRSIQSTVMSVVIPVFAMLILSTSILCVALVRNQSRELEKARGDLSEALDEIRRTHESLAVLHSASERLERQVKLAAAKLESLETIQGQDRKSVDGKSPANGQPE